MARDPCTARMAADTRVWNMTGRPAMSLPLPWPPEGRPVGVQVAGAFAAEEQMLSPARQVEQAQPWMPRLMGPVIATI